MGTLSNVMQRMSSPSPAAGSGVELAPIPFRKQWQEFLKQKATGKPLADLPQVLEFVETASKNSRHYRKSERETMLQVARFLSRLVVQVDDSCHVPSGLQSMMRLFRFDDELVTLDAILGITQVIEYYNHGCTTLVPRVTRFLKSQNHQVRAAALRLIYQVTKYSRSERLANVFKTVLHEFTQEPDSRVRLVATDLQFRYLNDTSLEQEEIVEKFYRGAAVLLRDWDVGVRQHAMKVIWLIGTLQPECEIELPVETSRVSAASGSIRLADDAFVRICHMASDISPRLRALACSYLAKFTAVSEVFLFQALNRKVSSEGNQAWPSVAKPSQAVNSKTLPKDQNRIGSLMDPFQFTAAGALVDCIEDEYSEVRFEAIDTTAKISQRYPKFASSASDYLFDALNDEIQVVRSKALAELGNIAKTMDSCGGLKMDIEQAMLILFAIRNANEDFQESGLHVLSHIRIEDEVALGLLLNKLFDYIDSVLIDLKKPAFKCLQCIGRNHRSMVRPLVNDILGLAPKFRPGQHKRTSLAYIARHVVVVNAAFHEDSGQCWLGMLPNYIEAQYQRFREQYPECYPSGYSDLLLAENESRKFSGISGAGRPSHVDWDQVERLLSGDVVQGILDNARALLDLSEASSCLQLESSLQRVENEIQGFEDLAEQVVGLSSAPRTFHTAYLQVRLVKWYLNCWKHLLHLKHSLQGRSPSLQVQELARELVSLTYGWERQHSFARSLISGRVHSFTKALSPITGLLRIVGHASQLVVDPSDDWSTDCEDLRNRLLAVQAILEAEHAEVEPSVVQGLQALELTLRKSQKASLDVIKSFVLSFTLPSLPLEKLRVSQNKAEISGGPLSTAVSVRPIANDYENPIGWRGAHIFPTRMEVCFDIHEVPAEKCFVRISCPGNKHQWDLYLVRWTTFSTPGGREGFLRIRGEVSAVVSAGWFGTKEVWIDLVTKPVRDAGIDRSALGLISLLDRPARILVKNKVLS